MKIFLYKSIPILSLFLVVIFLNGCWDYHEVEKRGYVLGIGVDKAYPIPMDHEKDKYHESEKKIEETNIQSGKIKYAYTIQIPILPKAQIKPFGSGGGTSGSRSWNLTILGNSFFEANRTYSTRLDYPPFYEHLQTVIINEKVAREGIIKPLDMILRDPEMRRRTKIFITPQEAHDILDVTPKIDDTASMYLSQLPHNASKTSRLAHLTDMGQVSESLHSGLDFALPRVIASKNEIKDAGLAAFKGDKMVGWLNEIQTIYLKWIRNLVKGGVIVITAPHMPNESITLELAKVKTKVRPIIKDEKIIMHIQSKATVNIVEQTGFFSKDTLSNHAIEEIEKKAEEKVKQEIIDTIKYIQNDLGADVTHFNAILKAYAPKAWEKVKDQWDYIFKNLPILVDIDIKVNHAGTTK